MHELMRKFIKEHKLNNKKKSFELAEIENYMVSKYGRQTNYSALGGYDTFYNSIKTLEKESKIRSISASGFNG